MSRFGRSSFERDLTEAAINGNTASAPDPGKAVHLGKASRSASVNPILSWQRNESCDQQGRVWKDAVDGHGNFRIGKIRGK